MAEKAEKAVKKNKSALCVLPGVGPTRATQLEKLQIREPRDLALFFPRRYEDRSAVLPINALYAHYGEMASVVAAVLEPPRERRVYGGRLLTQVSVGDRSGAMTVTFFNNPYIAAKLRVGAVFNFYGRVELKLGLSMVAPQIEPIGKGAPPGVFPVYPLTAGLSQNQMRRWVREALDYCAPFEDPLPAKLLEKYSLLPLEKALRAVHTPRSMGEIAAGRRRLVFEELLYFQLGLSLYSRREKEENRFPVRGSDNGFRALHSFTPTAAQTAAVREILHDMGGRYAMNRLLQGDVGSGKTYVAGEAAYAALKCGYQAAIMAPTEILARQHAAYFTPLFERCGFSTALLVGSTPAAEKKRIKAALASGALRCVIGTHALLQQDVRFARLGLVIADEQHRFGVRQRAALAAKGEYPHILVMSATPIPRTMALMVWGDLDLSVLDELPAGRKPVRSYLVGTEYKPRLRAFLQKEIENGGQAYIVCPLVEESEESDLASAVALREELEGVFPGQTELVHGKMRPALKEEAMRRFVAGETKLLISTTVIEVGVNVPAATVMVIENAERFGLSQLHQLRGRVGRGNQQAYCVLISDQKNPLTRERMTFFCSTTDGFAISRKDLELRGPGNFFGEQQHGLPKMQIADAAADLELLSLSNQCARRILEYDPALKADYNRKIAARVEALFAAEGIIYN